MPNSVEDSKNGGFYASIAVLNFLYLLQGVPLGISAAIPTILQNLGTTYHEQAVFSLATWPFSLKILWAPIVDTKYLKILGLRKTWILTSQLLVGAMMLFLSNNVDNLLETRQISMLTLVFVVLNFLAATQDIAVDGWALTMLPKKYVGWASTCNSVGQSAGYFIGNVVLLTLESSHFSLSTFLLFWGLVFLVGSLFVCIFKKEVDYQFAEQNSSIFETYNQLYDICRLPVVRFYLPLVLTWKIGYIAAEEIAGLKLIEAGLSRDRLALLTSPLTLIQLLLPLAISHISSGPAPLIATLDSSWYRLIMATAFPFIVYWTRSFGGQFPYYYYAVVVLLYSVHQIFAFAVDVNQTAYHAQVSDPRLGGTYMTLLNTLTNLGVNWPVTFALWLIDDFTLKQSGVTLIDGYYFECFVFFIIGLIWLKLARSRVETVQYFGTDAWTKWRRTGPIII